MARGISLANKCQLLFGAAVLLIVTAALIGPWIRLGGIVDGAQLETSRQIAELWTRSQILDPDMLRFLNPLDASGAEDDPVGLEIRWWEMDDWEQSDFSSGFLGAAHRALLIPEAGAGARELI